MITISLIREAQYNELVKIASELKVKFLGLKKEELKQELLKALKTEIKLSSSEYRVCAAIQYVIDTTGSIIGGVSITFVAKALGLKNSAVKEELHKLQEKGVLKIIDGDVKISLTWREECIYDEVALTFLPFIKESKRKRDDWGDKSKEMLRLFYEEGLNRYQIAKKLGTYYAFVHGVIKRHEEKQNQIK